VSASTCAWISASIAATPVAVASCAITVSMIRLRSTDARSWLVIAAFPEGAPAWPTAVCALCRRNWKLSAVIAVPSTRAITCADGLGDGPGVLLQPVQSRANRATRERRTAVQSSQPPRATGRRRWRPG
jgi:hypothetical protein